MRRFFCKWDTGDGERVALPEGESRHISKVLRLQGGENIELLDGEGAVYSARILETGRTVYVRILERIGREHDPGPGLLVGQGVLKGKKMDTVVQKCTELGVSRFQPFVSSRCQGKVSDSQGEKKNDRFQRIVEAACKQCLRPDLMAVAPTVGFRELVESRQADTGGIKLLFWEEEKERGLHDLDFSGRSGPVWILLGPEGGFAGRR